MWTIIKFDRKNLTFLKRDLKDKLGNNFLIYTPKLFIQKFKKNKLINKEFNLLGDYLFCFHKNFKDPKIINNLKFTRGLKFFLNGFVQSQEEIKEFIEKCKNSENSNGYLSQNFFEMNINSEYKFSSGPFAEMIFKVLSFQKRKTNILLGNIKTTVNKDDFLFNPL